MAITKTPAFTISSASLAARKQLDIRSGDTVRVWVKVEEKGKTRLQAFEGMVLARKGGTEPGATFTVRRVAGGYGVEKIFPLYSPAIDKIEILRRVKTRRAKLYHIREKAAREIRRQMRKMQFVNISSETFVKEEAELAAALAASQEPEVIENEADEVTTPDAEVVSAQAEDTSKE